MASKWADILKQKADATTMPPAASVLGDTPSVPQDTSEALTLVEIASVNWYFDHGWDCEGPRVLLVTACRQVVMLTETLEAIREHNLRADLAADKKNHVHHGPQKKPEPTLPED